MRATWHRSEQRDVRPFFAAARAQDAVAESKIRLFEDSEPSSDTTFDIEEPALIRLRPVILPMLVPPERWLPDGYGATEFGLVVLATNPFLRLSLTIQEISLDAGAPEEVMIPTETLEELGGGRNLTLTVALVLKADRSPSPGRPFVIGHWLAKKDFNIRMPGAGRFFDVQLRDDKEWVQAGYPAKTLYAVDYHGGICEETNEADPGIATVYVHSDIHSKIANDRLGEGIQKFIAVEAIVQILQYSIEDWKDQETIEERSPLATVLRNISSGGEVSISDLRSLVEGSRRRHLRSLLQSHMSIVRSLT